MGYNTWTKGAHMSVEKRIEPAGTAANRPLIDVSNEVDERFTNIGVNVVVIIITIVAFFPLFTDPDFYAIPLVRRVAIIGLGLLYLFNGTYGMIVHERHLDQVLSSVIFFTLQIGITMTLFSLSRGLNSGLWLLILPLAAQTLALFSWTMTLLISGVLLFGVWYIYLRGQSLAATLMDLLSIGSSLIFTLIFTYIAVKESINRVKIEELAVNLRQANHRLAEYAAQVEELATTKERNRLAREIHDNLGHYLTVINVQIEVAKTVMTNQPEQAQEALEKAQKMTQDGLTAVRQSVGALRESPLAQKTLVEAIAGLVEDSITSGIASQLIVAGEERPLDSKISLTLYRVAQEGLTNIRKHAQAKNAQLTLTYASNDVALVVQDDGVGAENVKHGGFGLIGTAERVHLLGGKMEIDTAPQAGLTLTVQIPTV
jgi:signal transduction histidine kinase